jgi:hypothetical protein
MKVWLGERSSTRFLRTGYWTFENTALQENSLGLVDFKSKSISHLHNTAVPGHTERNQREQKFHYTCPAVLAI